MLHPDVEWYQSPKLLLSEMLHGRNDARNYVQALYERFADQLEVVPEDGRQTGDHVLLVTVFKGVNHFTGQPVKARECWVISIRDDKWGRIVVYPNAPAARLGFEQLLRTTDSGTLVTDSPPEAPPGDTLAPAMAEAAAPTAAEFANAEAPAPATGKAAAKAQAGTTDITLTFTFEEAEAINRWMLRPAQDGALAADDAAVLPGLMKVRSAVEHAQAISEVRHELEQAGIPIQHLSDQQVAQLSQRISQAAPRLGGPQQG
jgi:ketosteroid isomerase-like protein